MILFVSFCCTLRTVFSCNLSPHVYFFSVCVSSEVSDHIQLPSLNFKVLYIGRENDVTLPYFVGAFCELCSIRNGMRYYELIQMFGVERHVFQ
jgi:hypothetical protein